MKTLVFPDKNAIRSRIREVCGVEHTVDGVARHLDARAGVDTNGPGVVLTVQLAIADYLKGMPPIMAPIMQMHVPALVAALCRDDAEVAADAAAMLDQIEERSRQNAREG